MPPTARSISRKKCNGQVCCPAIASLPLTARKHNPHAVGRSGYAVETLGSTSAALARLNVNRSDWALSTDAIPRRTHGNPALQNALHACVIGPERHLLRDSNGLELGVKRKGWRALKTSLMTHSSFLASIEFPPHHQLTTSRPRRGVWPIIQFDFTGSVRNRSLEVIKGGSFITEIEVCCPSSISRKFPIALVMFSLNFAPA